MRLIGRHSRHSRGVGSIIGAVFVALILLSGFTFYAFTQDVTQHYNNTMSAMNDMDWNRNQEHIIIKQIAITGTNQLSVTAENDGSIQSHLIWLGIFNKTASPETQMYQALNELVAPSEIDNIISNFTVAVGNKYVVQLVTELGNVVESKFYPASYVSCALTLVTAPPTVYQGNNVTVLLTVTPNDTEVDSIQSLTVTLNATPTNLVQLVSNSSLSVSGLTRGTSAYFWWIYNAVNTGTITFNATYLQAPAGTYALSIAQIVNPPQQGGQGNVTITGINCTGSQNPSQWNLLGSTQNVSGSIADLASKDSSYDIFNSYYSGTNIDISHFVDNNSSNVDNSTNFGTHSNFTALQKGPDAIYDTLTEGFTGTMTACYPSSYNLFGSTSYVSGALSDLQSDNAAYMTFRSYISAVSSTAKTDAFCGYRSNTGTGYVTPKARDWTGPTATWSAENELATAGSNVRTPRVAYSPLLSRALDKMMVTTCNDGLLDAYYWDGTSWTVYNNIADTGTASNDFQCFDIAFEHITGRCLLVYSRGTATNEIGYKIWTIGSGWSSETLLELPYTTGRVNWVELAPCPATRSGTADDNEIAFICIDVNEDVQGLIWTGSAWSFMGSAAVWDATAATSTREMLAVNYEVTTGEAMWIWGDSVAAHQYYRTWDGSTLSATTDLVIANEGGVVAYLTLQANPTNDDFILTVIDAASDLNTAYWDGSAWTVSSVEHDADVDVMAQRCADGAWESDGSDALLVWGTATGTISWQKFTPPDTWTAISTPVYSGTKRWIQLRTNPRSISGDVMILGAVSTSTLDIGCIKWDGTTFTVVSETAFTSAIGVSSWECFDLEFANFIPSEMKSEVEFLGSSNLDAWDSLKWTIDSSFTTTVTATFQLYDFNSGSYPTGAGSGYMTSSIGSTDVTMEQTISTNPTYFRDGSGNWRMKITGVLSGKTVFDWRGDLVRYQAVNASYQLDLEVQWTGAEYTQENAWLCIFYGGTLGTENLTLDLWTGTVWQNVFGVLSNGWNNVSVSTYLTSSLFTIKFKGATPGDAVQDNWNIDVCLLHLWTIADAYTAEIEFTGSSNLQSWTSLVWLVDSSWDTGSVNVTIQLYDWTLGNYPLSGNGYLSYVSNAAPYTDETKSQTIVSGATQFRNSTGYWKVKIKGVKSTSTQFQVRVDWIELQDSYASTGDTIPYNACQWYTIQATGASGTPVPYVYVSLYANGTTVTFQNATDATSVPNPAWILLDANGTFQLQLKSATSPGETFVLSAAVGTVVEQKTITQAAQ